MLEHAILLTPCWPVLTLPLTIQAANMSHLSISAFVAHFIYVYPSLFHVHTQAF